LAVRGPETLALPAVSADETVALPVASEVADDKEPATTGPEATRVVHEAVVTVKVEATMPEPTLTELADSVPERTAVVAASPLAADRELQLTAPDVWSVEPVRFVTLADGAVMGPVAVRPAQVRAPDVATEAQVIDPVAFTLVA
jgi:hypothetical protein